MPCAGEGGISGCVRAGAEFGQVSVEFPLRAADFVFGKLLIADDVRAFAPAADQLKARDIIDDSRPFELQSSPLQEVERQNVQQPVMCGVGGFEKLFEELQQEFRIDAGGVDLGCGGDLAFPLADRSFRRTGPGVPGIIEADDLSAALDEDGNDVLAGGEGSPGAGARLSQLSKLVFQENAHRDGAPGAADDRRAGPEQGAGC